MLYVAFSKLQKRISPSRLFALWLFASAPDHTCTDEPGSMEEMCRLNMKSGNETGNTKTETNSAASLENLTAQPQSACRPRRSQRQKQSQWVSSTSIERGKAKSSLVFKKKKISEFAQRHEHDSASGGIGSLIPSLAGVIVLGGILMARSGFRGRATVAGIDLGTTNSVVCVQEQAAKEGGKSFSDDQ